MSAKHNILVLGSGGREHALCHKIRESPLCGALFCAPGNGGTGDSAKNIALELDDHAAIVKFCKDEKIALVVIGPEAPLVAGLADALEKEDIPAFGPSAAAAQLEGSKAFTKDLCQRAGIPTAAYQRFTTAAPAHDYAATQSLPVVIKADGLAAGKGVIIAETHDEAHAAIDDMFGGAFGAAGAEIIIEAFMRGEEVSFFALCDGTNALPLASAQDHKRVGDGDTGLNTGGMGAYSPASILTADLEAEVMARIINPTLAEMGARGMAYKGVLYAGLMLTDEGVKLVEYNCRFGDPECQVLMMRLKDDIVPLLLACTGKGATDNLAGAHIAWHDAVAISVVMAAKGYPAAYEKGTRINGLEQAAKTAQDVVIFHAGTKRISDKIVANGGRVLNITARAATISEAQKRAYAAIDAIDWQQGFCRRDIGKLEIARDIKSRAK